MTADEVVAKAIALKLGATVVVELEDGWYAHVRLGKDHSTMELGLRRGPTADDKLHFNSVSIRIWLEVAKGGAVHRFWDPLRGVLEAL